MQPCSEGACRLRTVSIDQPMHWAAQLSQQVPRRRQVAAAADAGRQLLQIGCAGAQQLVSRHAVKMGGADAWAAGSHGQGASAPGGLNDDERPK
jgi:hypothetical protein